MLKVGIECKDFEAKKFIAAVCRLNSEKIYLEKDVSLKELKQNRNDLLIIQEHTSDESDSQILEFVKNGGKVVLFPTSENKDESYKFQSWGKIQSASPNNFFEIQEWNRNEGIFANTANGKELALPYLKILKRKIPTEGETLAFYKDGKSFFTRKTIGNGIIYSFSTLPSREWSNLGEGFVLVPLLLRIFDECTESSSSNLLECGEDTSFKYNGLRSITGKPNEKPAIKAGIYKDLGKFMAFNRKASELQNKILKKEDFTETLSSEHIQWINSQTSNFSFARAEIWNFFLIVMLLFLLTESFLGLPMSNSPTKSKK